MTGPCVGIAATALLLLSLAVPTAPAATDGSPTPAEIAALRDRVDHHVARVRVGQDLYDIRGARFDDVGVAFDSHRLRPRRAVAYYEPRPPLPPSPIAWDRIDRITVRKPCGLRGAIAGGVVGTAALAGIVTWWEASNVEPGPAFFVLALPPVGATLGGAIGALTLRSESGWQRTGTAPAGTAEFLVPAADSSEVASAAVVEAPLAAEPFPSPLPPAPPEGRTVRLVLGSRTLVCRSPRFTPAGIALSPSAPGGPGYSTPAPLPWKDVDRIDVRGNSALTGAIIGAVAVGLFATAVGAAVASDPFLGEGSGGGEVLALTVMGAVTGAGAGALVGWSIPSWRNVYRRGAPTDATRARP